MRKKYVIINVRQYRRVLIFELIPCGAAFDPGASTLAQVSFHAGDQPVPLILPQVPESPIRFFRVR
jgi:hypothetical protein